jgi:hypothetical protein
MSNGMEKNSMRTKLDGRRSGTFQAKFFLAERQPMLKVEYICQKEINRVDQGRRGNLVKKSRSDKKVKFAIHLQPSFCKANNLLQKLPRLFKLANYYL